MPSTPTKESKKFVFSQPSSKSLSSFFDSQTHNSTSSEQLSGNYNEKKKDRKSSLRGHMTPRIEVKETNTMYKDYDPTTGNKMINKYMLIRELGRGVHGKAIKIVDRVTRRRLGSRNNDLTNEQKIRKEIAILKKCVHPHVVRLKEVIDDPMSRKIYMVIEYMEGGEIQWKDDHDRPVMSVDEARRIFRDVVLGLEYLHYQGIIHRDIKPANLLLTADNVVKISDFGVSHFSQRAASVELQGNNNPAPNQEDTDLIKTAGSPAFFAPELCFPGDLTREITSTSIVTGNSGNSSESLPKSHSTTNSISVRGQRPPITKAIDVWALGVTLYCFIFGRCPFIADTEFELFFHVIPRQPLEFPDDIPISDSLKDLLTRLLEKDPQKRITLGEVKKHPWVIADLPNPQKWRDDTDPKKYQALTVTDEEDRLKKKIRKISLSLGNLTLGNFRKRSKSVSGSLTSFNDSKDNSSVQSTPTSRD
ncbi:4814_t:CDS:2 [Gigaspora margarita]|uniref:4814_t:CDS:1 n=1 Tax=Gigaspora margarita TaxID=4874 RepID=A0ABN7UC43_GIGMA|nr:4814_t:CDS:2 [Gigaspora margarita]